LPIIGQPAHTHFIPVVIPVPLDRISLSVTYLYNISAAAFRVSLARTYVYNLKVIVSRSQAYLYNLNPVAPAGPTRLYFHAVLNPLPNLPTTERSTLTPNKTVDAETVNRTMSTVIGVAQTSLVMSSNAVTTLQRYYFSKFVTDTLTNVSSITAQTWTYNFAATSGGTNANFPTGATNQPVRVTAYVWRPSTQSKVGDIADGNSAFTVDEVTTTERAQHTTFSGNQVLGVQNGDVLVFEVWFEISQAAATALNESFFYDGTTVTTTKTTIVSNHASFIQTPQGLSFGIAPTRVSKARIQRYDIIARVSLTARVYRYNITKLASVSKTYQYPILTTISLSNSYLYDLIGRLSVPSINKYNILLRMAAAKIFRYGLQSRLQSSRLYKYNIATGLANSWIYKYNIASAVSVSQTYKYAINSALHLARLYKYSLISRLSLAPVYKYNIANRISSSKIYKYALAVRTALSRAYKYNLLNTLTSSSHYKYSIITRVSLSRIYKFNISTLVTLARVYKYNLTSLAHIVLSSVYKYNLANRLSSTRIYAYSILNKITSSRIYRYALTVRATTSAIYRYSIMNAVTLSRTYRYNLLVRLLASTRRYLYNLLALRQKPQAYIYNLAKTISTGRIYRYRLGSGVSVSQTYLYNSKARVSLSTKYIYGILVLPSGVLWQLTGKNTDFPDSLENLVRDYIIENWSITEPVIGESPMITTAISRQHQTQVDNFAYDNYRTYYIRVKEVASEVKNRQIRLNTYEFETPIQLECFSRRLKKGEAFNELNNVMNELLRIFGTYQAEGIFGVQGITLDRISSMEKERPPAMTTWARRLRIILHYYKVSVVG
jgi:hypothetical protein